MRGFLCLCSECSLEGEELGENERIREDIREKEAEVIQLMSSEGSDQVPRRNVKKAMKFSQQRVKLVQKLGLLAEVAEAMIHFYLAATRARRMNISILANDPDVFRDEALKYAKMYGDRHIHFYNKYIN